MAKASKAPPRKAAKSKTPLADTLASTQDMAAVLGVTPRWLSKMVTDGIVPQVSRGRFKLGEVVQAYSVFLKQGAEKNTGSISLDRLRDEKAKEIQLNRLRKDRALIDLDEALGVIDQVTGMFVSSLNGLPAQITGVPRERQRLDGIFDTERQRLADRFAEKREALRTGGAALDPESEDDAA